MGGERGGGLAGRVSLALAPTGPRGWFGGTAVSAEAPAGDALTRGATLEAAGDALEAAFEGRDPALVAVLLTYEGDATILRFPEWDETAAGDARLPEPVHVPRDLPLIAEPTSGMTARRYRANVRAVCEAVAAGDVYVLNLTYPLTGHPALPGARETFAALHARAGAEMSAFLGMEGLQIASVSPERFLRVVRGGSGGAEREVEVCPIKGTRPRGCDPVSDRALAAELLASEKERAEHVMVVDMERNDLGRVCEPGSVRVDSLFEIVATPYCHQMVSRVAGTLRAGVTFGELLSATFPCGSVTGAPKLAAMRIAAGLEGVARGPYTGALLVARTGELDSSVLIRTAVIEDGRLTWGTGCGITHDSDPPAEWLETLLKASPVLGDTVPPVALRETCRIAANGSVPLLDRHLARLAAGGCGLGVLARVRVAVASCVAEGAAVARLGCCAAPAPSAPAGARLAVTVTPDGAVECVRSDRPSALDVPGGPLAVPVCVAAPPPLPPGAAKPADRTPWDAAQAEAGPQSQAVLMDPQGALIDGASATVWLRSGRELLTPPSPPAVAGVAREVVFDLAQQCGYRASERVLTIHDLDTAEEVFFSNAYAGVVAARGRGGEAAGRLRRAWPQDAG